MADELHRQGYDVTHVDVGPEGALPGQPYAVTVVPGLRYEDAGAAHIQGLVERLTG
ncbi:hypothetical protein [Blastococcus brunescens]|uniref:Uncharacterized protein n=1 Tax=Blastococcus brunescens TaxID=1564165 RepID=A0ABZ1B6L3_9ACTN|nr:hypothetical protein [Blastococcus sp. BMG 8361]WRL66450.1 hypothetical protein U6N30_14100 [Blastococcus sp. BMG 8361]